jgi:hypothetical protein
MDGERLQQAQAHIALHFGNDKLWIALQQMESSMKQRMVRLDADLTKSIANMNEKGAYFSLNSFAKTNRRAESLWYLHAFYVDMDCGKLGMDPNEVLETLERDYWGVALPSPVYVLLSGRGIWAVWTIKPRRNDMKRENVRRWKETQAFLIETLRPFGADWQASVDVSRTCRLAGSINQKNGADVRLKVYEPQGRYSLADLHDFASPYAYDDVKNELPTSVDRSRAGVIDIRALILSDDQGDTKESADEPP